MMSGSRRKVVIVGAGAVGSTFAFALAQSGLADDIVILDNNEKLVRGQVLDLAHGQSFFPTVSIRCGTVPDYRDADIIVITAGRSQHPGESRLQLVKDNADIVQGIVRDITGQGSGAILFVVTNPVDVMTYVALKASGWDKRRVIGSGTVLDSARLRHILSAFCNVNVHNVHGYVLGEHGDSECVAWSMTNIAGIQIDTYCPLCRKCSDWMAERARIAEEVCQSAYHVIDYKGATNFAVSLVMVTITEAILRGQMSVLTVSTMLEGEFGLSDVCLSVPSIVSSGGIDRIIQGPLKADELDALTRSAYALKNVIRDIGMRS